MDDRAGISPTEKSIAIPAPRGPASEALVAALAAPTTVRLGTVDVPRGDALGDGDLHLSLYLCYELHYRGLPGVDPAKEWDPGVLGFRARLERAFEGALRANVRVDPARAGSVPNVLRSIARGGDGALSRYLERRADLAQMREFLIHRSAYHLKEADPHSFAIPRLTGAAKAALVEIQADEYGGGDASWMHAALFARTLAAVGLDARYGAFIDRIPGWTLATVNLMSLFGLHRRLLGALVGHLAAFEMSSTLPNRRYGNGLRRLGFGPDATLFFDEHVEADAVHEAIAADDLAGTLVAEEPELSADVLFGAEALGLLEGIASARTLGAWTAGASSLLPAPVGPGPIKDPIKEASRVA